MGKRLFKLVMALHIFLYRRSAGKIWGQMRGMDILLLTTTGRKSAQRRTVPIMYLADGANYAVIASNNGSDSDPAWWLNLQHDSQATIEVGGSTKSVVAEKAPPAEKSRLWAELAARAPFFEDYQTKTSRDISVIILRPTEAG
jgi:deazaflavin-dependent oxidoreductase (nitroreductase family)